MSIAPGFTNAEIRDLVREYVLLPHGRRASWVAEQDFTYSMMNRWRTTVFEGDPDRALIPREGISITIRRNERTALERARAAEHAAHAAEVAKRTTRVRELEDTITVLGKAFGLLHAMSEEEPATPQQTTDEPTNS